MNLPASVGYAAAILVAAALAWWPWRGAPGTWLGHAGRAARFVAIAALLLLVLDPGIRATLRHDRPLVLLDNSVSMHATGGQADSAAALASGLGEVLPFGEVAAGEPGAQSALAEALSRATGAGRPIVVVSDGEIPDAATIPPDLLAQASLRILPRRTGPNVALVDVRVPLRLTVGDTMSVEVVLQATTPWTDSVHIEVRDSGHVLMRGSAVPGPDGRARMALRAPLPSDRTGARRLEVIRVGAPDAEPLDDLRIRWITVTPTPGVVVVAAVPDWDARALHATLADLIEAPVRGYIQLASGAWRRMDDLRPVAEAEVVLAARNADLLAVRGDTTAWRQHGRARLLWPAGGIDGDWYSAPVPSPSPLMASFAGVEPDSLPPLPAVAAVPEGEWVALSARQARRGNPVPILAGHQAGGRTVVMGGSGFHRWSFQGGVAEQAWRAMIGQAAAWLLDAPVTAGTSLRAEEAVVERGRAVRFRAPAGAPPMAIELAASGVVRTDTLRFDADGVGRLALSPGLWTWQGADGSAGRIEVESYARELVPIAPTLASADAAVTAVPVRRSLRELLPFFALAVAGFVTEWVIRRRMGLR